MIFWKAVANELHGHGFKTRNERSNPRKDDPRKELLSINTTCLPVSQLIWVEGMCSKNFSFLLLVRWKKNVTYHFSLHRQHPASLVYIPETARQGCYSCQLGESQNPLSSLGIPGCPEEKAPRIKEENI